MMQMRHTAHELRVTLDHVMQGGEAAVAPQNSQDETVSFLNEPEAEMSAVHNIPEVSTTGRLLPSHFVIGAESENCQCSGFKNEFFRSGSAKVDNFYKSSGVKFSH